MRTSMPSQIGLQFDSHGFESLHWGLVHLDIESKRIASDANHNEHQFDLSSITALLLALKHEAWVLGGPLSQIKWCLNLIKGQTDLYHFFSLVSLQFDSPWLGSDKPQSQIRFKAHQRPLIIFITSVWFTWILVTDLAWVEKGGRISLKLIKGRTDHYHFHTLAWTATNLFFIQHFCS